MAYFLTNNKFKKITDFTYFTVLSARAMETTEDIVTFIANTLLLIFYYLMKLYVESPKQHVIMGF